MILRNGINSTLRARGRSVLFTLLIFILTITMILGVGMWTYCRQIQPKLDEKFTSVALVEYMGSNYPNTKVADEFARQASQMLNGNAISKIDGVKFWEFSDRSLALVDGYSNLISRVPYPDNAVLECMSFVPIYTDGTVEYTLDELPSNNLIIRDDWTAKLQFDAVSTDWLPLYDVIDGEYTQNLPDGLVATPADELPNACILRETFDLGNAYGYYKDGEIQINLSTLFNNVYHYQSETDTYIGNGQVVAEYSAICADVLYAYGKSKNIAIFLDANDIGFVPEPDKHYMLHGTFVAGGKANSFILTDFYEGCDIAPYQEVGNTDISPLFQQYADLYRNANNSVKVEASKNIAALEVFHQNELTLMKGRFPNSGESGVCVITWDMAQYMQLDLGDKITMSPMRSQENHLYNLDLPSNTMELKVAGITGTSEEHYGSIWVTEADGNFENPLFGYELGRAVLENSSASAAADAIESICPENVRVTLFDQGYAAAVQALQTMESTAITVSFMSGCGVIAVLILFAFLFIGRQRETVQILVSLGTSTRQIRQWLLSGATLICGAATLAGALIGGSMLDMIIHLAFRFMNSIYSANQRYSESAIGYVQEQVLDLVAPKWPAIIAGVSIFLISLILCVLFLAQARRKSTPKRGKLFVRVPKSGTSTAWRGPFRFAILNVRRSGWRSVTVPVAALVLSLLLGILASIAQGWNSQLKAIYQDTTITGQAVSNNGRQINDLVVSTEDARTLWKSGNLNSLHVSIGWNYWHPSDIPTFSNSSFGAERRLAWIRQQPKLIALNGLSAAGEFMYGQSPEVTWLDGWDEDFLTSEEYPSFLTAESFPTKRFTLPPELESVVYPCIVSEVFLNSHDAVLGDIIHIGMIYEHASETRETYVQILPVGMLKTTSESNIYVPLSFWCPPSLITDAEYPYDSTERPNSSFMTYPERDRFFYSVTTFDTCTFALNYVENLESFRDYLEDANISQVRKVAKNRLTIILRDRSFTDKIEGLGRYISFSKILFPILFVLVATLGFVISWLMVNGRRMEFAILRGLGASRRRVFWSIFLEQMLLCVIGSFSGGITLSALLSGVSHWLAVCIFQICYLAGCALAVISVSRTNLVMLLSEREA